MYHQHQFITPKKLLNLQSIGLDKHLCCFLVIFGSTIIDNMIYLCFMHNHKDSTKIAKLDHSMSDKSKPKVSWINIKIRKKINQFFFIAKNKLHGKNFPHIFFDMHAI